MAALTVTSAVETEFAGDVRVKVFTTTLQSASDTVDLSSEFDTLYAVIPVLQGGADANLLAGVQCSFSGTTATLVTIEADGTASTNWDNATIRLIVIGAE